MKRGALTISIGLCVLAATVEGQEPLGVEIALDDPSGTVVTRLGEALERAARGRGVARLSFWGASHTASDQYTGFLRERLTARFGDAGPGFFLPMQPFSLYFRRDLALTGSGFTGVAIRGDVRRREAYGRSGAYLEATGEAFARATPSEENVGHVELWALAQPGGGTLTLTVAGESVTLETDGERRAIYAELDVETGRHGIEVRAAGDGPVRVFGVLAESRTPGVIVESFGVPGARARDQLRWETDLFVEHVARRQPDLFSVAYGTNESAEGNGAHPVADVASELREVIDRLQTAAPDAACLVIGPSDRPVEHLGTWEPRPRSSTLNEAMRGAAHAEGCAFFDLLAFQGGPGSIERWIERGWAIEDHVHMTDEGHERLAEVLSHALVP